jgi:hypothetical protein
VTTLGRLPAAETTAIASTPRGLLIDGEWGDAASAGTFTVEDPSTGSLLCDVADAGAVDGVVALDAAVRAQPTWGVSARRDRAAILRRAYEGLIAARERLALVLTLEMGKPLAESDDEIGYAAEYLFWFAEEAIRAARRTSHSARRRPPSRETPVGDREGEHATPQVGVRLHGRLHQDVDHVVSDADRVGERLERQRVLRETRDAAEVGHRPEGHHQVVERQFAPARGQARAEVTTRCSRLTDSISRT